MNPIDKLPRSGPVFGNLTPEEEQALYRAAFEDQDLYNELANQHAITEALATPQARNLLLAEIERLNQPAWRRAVAWLQHPAVLTAATVTAASVICLAVWRIDSSRTAGIIVDQRNAATSRYDPATAPAGWENVIGIALAERLFALSGSGPITGSLAINGNRFRTGDEWRMQIVVREHSRAIAVERRSDGTYVRLFPNRAHASSELSAGAQVAIPPSGEEARLVRGPTGERVVRLILFPPDLEPQELPSISPDRLVGKITVIEKVYEVTQ